jgi:hypothetical protein
MKQFNIDEIIKHYKLDAEDLSRVLFPSVKYPKQAFDRVLKGETNLDIGQIEKLASHIGVLVSDLFNVNKWKGSSEDGCIIMLKGDYKAKLGYNGVFLSIYKNNELLEQKISDVPSMTMEEFNLFR